MNWRWATVATACEQEKGNHCVRRIRQDVLGRALPRPRRGRWQAAQPAARGGGRRSAARHGTGRGLWRGADAVWLASRGWRVTAVDIAATALARAREHAESLGADLASRIDWVEADLTSWTPAEERFDLVSTHYVHLAASREALFGRLAASVAPGGTLLIVGHHPSDPHTTHSHGPSPAVHFTAEEVAADLDPGLWDIAVAEARSRSATAPDGHKMTMHDAVVRARRRPWPTEVTPLR
ncbi:class I SAM-dependent methyltransferase [Nonomuraea recticatena]|uniref:class I SAM-dependent methyltransferase n=1 Tax=Nonomuraea recticatena TaxID=46178 RepID=UPI0036122679